MAPLVRRSWAPRGKTPILRQRTRSHKKVSAVAAFFVWPPSEASVRFRLCVDSTINTDIIIEFLKNLLRHTPQPLIIVWDRLHAHVSVRTKDFIRSQHKRLRVYLLPPYAPELNPVEQIWGYLKMNPMANHPIHDTGSLAAHTRKHARSVQMRRNLLQAFLEHTPLSF